MFYLLSKILWLFAAPATFLVILTATGTFYAWLRSSKVATGLAVFGASSLLIVTLTPMSTLLILPLESRFPEPDMIDPKDAPYGIVTLGGESGDRLNTLVKLARRFPQAKLVYSGPGSTARANEIARQFVDRGGEPGRLLFEARSRNTFENAIYTAELVKPDRHRRWLLITSAAHMPRAVGCFRLAGFVINAYPVDFRTGERSEILTSFVVGSEALVAFDAAAKEWIGLVTYWLSGKSDALLPSP